MINDVKNDAQIRMQKSIEALRHDLTKLRRELEASRDYIFEKAGVQHDLFA